MAVDMCTLRRVHLGCSAVPVQMEAAFCLSGHACAEIIFPLDDVNTQGTN